jgi:phosphoesterase RecJ-like protein
MVYLIAKDLGVELNRDLAEALYVGLVTDTGRFMYSNTGAAAHMMAADLIAAGVDVPAAYRRLYEGKPLGKMLLEARAIASIRQYAEGLTVINLTRADLEETGTDETHTEGIVEFARAVEGTRVAATYREMTREGREHLAKISLRSADDRVNVSEIAQLFGGGGHRQAAGATTELSLDEAVAKVRGAIAEQLSEAV